MSRSRGGYRFRRGRKTEQFHDKRTEHANAENAREEQDAELELQRQQGLMGIADPRGSERDDAGDGDMEDDAAKSVHRGGTTFDVGSEGGRSAAAQTVRYAPCAAPASGRSGGSKKATPTKLGIDDRDSDDDSQPETVSTRTGEPSAKKRRSSLDNSKTKLAALLEKVSNQWTFEMHWESKCRSRDFENLISRITAKSRVVAAFITDADASELSERGYQVADQLERRQLFFDCLRMSFQETALRVLTESEVEILKSGPEELVSCILMLGTNSIVAKITPGNCNSSFEALLSLLRHVPEEARAPSKLSYDEAAVSKKLFSYAQKSIKHKCRTSGL